MTLSRSGQNEQLGSQRPRVLSLPESAASWHEGEDAAELAAMAGLVLDPWQKFALKHMLAKRADGAWAAFEAALVVSRQNGKSALLAAYELACLFLYRERLVIHSAHQYDTSMESMRLLLELIEGTPELSRQVKKRGVSRSHGAEGIELEGSRRIRFRTRTKGGGRGFSGGKLVFDEAMMFPAAMHSALMFVVSAQADKQIVYAGSAVDQEVHEDGWVLAGLRARAVAGGDPALAYLEWSAGDDIDKACRPDFARDPKNWAAANPALGIRITSEHVANEQRAMNTNPRGFAVERLGVGDWPEPAEENAAAVIPADVWARLKDPSSELSEATSLAFDVRPDFTSAAICAAGRRADGKSHVEVIRHDAGTKWVVPELVNLAQHGIPFRYAEDSPAAALVKAAQDAGVDLEPIKAKEYGEGCDQFLAAVEQDTLRHLGDPVLAAAVAGAATKPRGESKVWSRARSHVDITPLVACTIARWGLDSGPAPSVYETRGVLDFA